MPNDSSCGLHDAPDHTEAAAAEALSYSNPRHQRMGPRWVRGELVYAMPCGVIHIDPGKQRWSKE